MNNPEYLTAQELAAALRVSLSTIRRGIKSGKIPCIRVNRATLRFHLETVISALQKP